MFFICLVPYNHLCLYYFLILCSYFHFLFLILLATRHVLPFTIFDSISLKPSSYITETRKTLRSPRRKKKCRVNYNQNKCSSIIIYGAKYEFFLSPYSHSYSHITILWQKNFLTIFHTENYHWTANEIK